MTNDPKIVDVIAKKSPFSDRIFYYVVVDQPLRYIYARAPGNYFIGKHGDFYDFLAGTSRKGEAFGSREFDIKLDDGGTFHCQGDVWSVGAPKDFIPVVGAGFGSLDELHKCYVFCSGNVAKSVLDDWLSKNEPTDNYYKYDPRTPPPPPAGARRVGKQRARTLRKRGVSIFWSAALRSRIWVPLTALEQNNG